MMNKQVIESCEIYCQQEGLTDLIDFVVSHKKGKTGVFDAVRGGGCISTANG